MIIFVTAIHRNHKIPYTDMLLIHLLQSDAAGAVANLAEAVPAREELSFSLIDMAFKGGWLMIPLFVLSIFTISPSRITLAVPVDSFLRFSIALSALYC